MKKRIIGTSIILIFFTSSVALITTHPNSPIPIALAFISGFIILVTACVCKKTVHKIDTANRENYRANSNTNISENMQQTNNENHQISSASSIRSYGELNHSQISQSSRPSMSRRNGLSPQAIEHYNIAFNDDNFSSYGQPYRVNLPPSTSTFISPNSYDLLEQQAENLRIDRGEPYSRSRMMVRLSTLEHSDSPPQRRRLPAIPTISGAVPPAESMHEEVPLPTYAEALEDIVKELMNKDESDEVILFPPPPTYMEAIQFKKDSG